MDTLIWLSFIETKNFDLKFNSIRYFAKNSYCSLYSETDSKADSRIHPIYDFRNFLENDQFDIGYFAKNFENHK